MSTEQFIEVRGIKVQIVRKDIKNLHLGVYPPSGRVRVAAPLSMTKEAVRLAVVGKIGWIGRQRTRFLKQPRQSEREMVSGESHYFLGRRYRLRVVEIDAPEPQCVVKRPAIIELKVRSGSSTGGREAVLDRWYREQLRELAAPLLVNWQAKLGIQPASWGIKRMKTKWGACNTAARSIWLNLELVKSPPECIEYIVLHEVVHLVARRHDKRFIALMDKHLPGWSGRRELLNSMPLRMWPC